MFLIRFWLKPVFGIGNSQPAKKDGRPIRKRLFSHSNMWRFEIPFFCAKQQQKLRVLGVVFVLWGYIFVMRPLSILGITSKSWLARWQGLHGLVANLTELNGTRFKTTKKPCPGWHKVRHPSTCYCLGCHLRNSTCSPSKLLLREVEALSLLLRGAGKWGKGPAVFHPCLVHATRHTVASKVGGLGLLEVEPQFVPTYTARKPRKSSTLAKRRNLLHDFCR